MKKKTAIKKNDAFKAIVILPSIIFTSLIILIVRLEIIDNKITDFWWNQQGGQVADFFSYNKMVMILLIASIAALIMIFKYFLHKLQIKPMKIYIGLSIYSVFVVLSYFFSDYKEYALFGWEDRYEGTLVLLAYMIMLFYTINMVNTERDVKWVIYSTIFTSFILGIIGLFQRIGRDFFATEFGKKIIMPQKYWQYLDQVSFKFQHNEIYQTVYNINYVSFYLTLIIPLVGLLFIHSKTKSLKLFYGFVFFITTFNLFGSSSSGGLIGLLISSVIALLIFRDKIFLRKKEAGILLLLILTGISMNYSTVLPELGSGIKSTFKNNTTIQKHELNNNVDTINIAGIKKPSLEFIETKDNSVIMSLNQEKIEFRVSEPELENELKRIDVYDYKGYLILSQSFNIDSVGYLYQIPDQHYDFCKIGIGIFEGTEYFLVEIPEMTWTFALLEDTIKYRTSYGTLVALEKIETIGFKGREGFGSGRGYIWSRSFPLLKNTIILGNGADTYAAFFPQHDFAGKYTGPSFSRNINTIIRKPHNMYIGTAINTGIISLLALLFVYFYYLLQSYKLYRRKTQMNFELFAGAGLFLGISGFLTAGMFYDSNVCVMPLFYGLLGTGIAINYKLNVKDGK